jgi:hypothetical protein
MEIMDFNKKIEEEIYEFAKNDIKKIFNDVNQHLIRKFDTQFKKGEDGKTRDWPNITLEDICKLHTEMKEKLEKIFPEFRLIRIPEYLPLKEMTLGASFEDTPGMKRNRTTIGDVEAKLMTEQQMNKAKDRFTEDCERSLDDAKRKHVRWFGYILVQSKYVSCSNVVLAHFCLLCLR